MLSANLTCRGRVTVRLVLSRFISPCDWGTARPWVPGVSLGVEVGTVDEPKLLHLQLVTFGIQPLFSPSPVTSVDLDGLPGSTQSSWSPCCQRVAQHCTLKSATFVWGLFWAKGTWKAAGAGGTLWPPPFPLKAGEATLPTLGEIHTNRSC
jgi:hypothetical protein